MNNVGSVRGFCNRAVGVSAAAVLALGGIVAIAPPAQAVASRTVAFYSMDEPPGATTMLDSSGNGKHGTIGSDVTPGAVFAGSTAHRFASHFPGGGAFSGHPDLVPNTNDFNPESGDFSVEVRVRTNYKFGNIVQKGQGSNPGGYWKFENPAGKPRCLFRGSNGASRTGYSNVEIDDGQWHTIRCNRTSTYVEMFIDGVRQSRLNGSTGTISNGIQLSVAGKSQCDGVDITCDYFVGDIDYLRIMKGSGGPANVPPVADVDTTCAGLICNVSGSDSTDSDGAIQRYQWSFGDGTTYDGVSQPTTSHTYAAAGTYTVTLTVTDDLGAVDTDTRQLTVAPILERISFVGQATSNANSATHQVLVPSSVQPGDALLLALSQNTHQPRSGPNSVTGWTLLDSLSEGFADTTMWSKVAQPGDAGSSVSVSLGGQSKGNLVLAAYRGTDTLDPVSDVSSFSEPVGSATRVSPFADVTVPGSWGVTYWMHGDSATSTLTPPTGVVVRSNSSQTGGGRVTAMLADSAATLPLGSYGGLAATAPAASSTMTAWTVVLAPEDGPPPPNQPPTAAFDVTCTGLTCSVDANGSNDPDGSIVSHAWTWGDGQSQDSGTDPTVSHTYSAPGDYTIALVVTDDDAASASTTRDVSVDEPPPPSDEVSFVDSASTSATASSHVVTVPATAQPGDALLLFMSVSGSATIGTPSVAGWTVVDTADDGSVRTRLWSKVATAGDAAASVSVTIAASSKANLVVAAYRGTGSSPVASYAKAVSPGTSAARVTPTVTVADGFSWVVSFWAHRDSATTALSVPAGVTSRASGTQGGGGRVTTLLADSGGVVPAGSYGGLVSNAQASSDYGTTWTVVLSPAP